MFLFTFFVGVGDAEIQKGIFHPRGNASFVSEVIEHFRHSPFPSAVDDHDVNVAVLRRIAVASRLAVNEAAAPCRIVVVQSRSNSLF